MATALDEGLAVALDELEDLIAYHWRRVDELHKEEAKLAANVAVLRQHEQVPMMLSDYPIQCWVKITEHHAAISALREARRKMMKATHG